MLYRVTLILFPMLGLAPPLEASPFDASIDSVGFEYSTSSNDLDDIRDNYMADLSFTSRVNLPADSHLFAGGRAIFRKSGQRSDADGSLISIGYAYQREGFSIKAGRQIVDWGKTDGLSPTAFLCPRDYTQLYIEDADKRQPIDAARIDISIDTDRIILVVAKNDRHTILPMPEAARILIDEAPSLQEPQFAARYELQNYNGLDTALTLFSGSLLNEKLDIKPPAEGIMQPFQWHIIKTRGWGLDAAINYDDFAIRGELAYTHPFDSPADPQIQGVTPQYTSILGADRVYSDWRIGAQLIVIYNPDYQYFPPGGTMADYPNMYNSLVYNQTAKMHQGFTLSLSNESSHTGRLKPEFFLIHFIHPQSTFFRPAIKYFVKEHHSFLLGAEIFSGAKDTFFETLKDNNKLALYYRYHFD